MRLEMARPQTNKEKNMADSNGSACQPNHTWDNWAGTIKIQTQCYFEPTTMDDLSSILQQAQTNGKKVRVVGSGHSWSLGAVPGEAPYAPDENIDAYLINVSNMNPENCGQDSYLKAFYFSDSGNTPYVAVPPGTAQGWLADNAGNYNDLLHKCSNKHADLALASMGPAPDITLGGFIANGCHGTGWNEPTVADLVCGIEVMTIDGGGDVVTKAYTINQELANILSQNGVTKSTPQASPEIMKALRVSLGALGVITKLVFQLEPMFNVAHLDEYVDLDQIFTSNGDYTNLETLVTSCNYLEIFWFPYTTQLWVKRYSKTNAATQKEFQVIGFDWITSEMAALTGNLLGKWFEWFPEATPLTLNIFFDTLKLIMTKELTSFDFSQDFDPSTDPIVKVKYAYLYQTKYFTNLLDLSYTLPIVQTQQSPPKYDFSNVMNAWNDVINQIQVMEKNGEYPVNLNVHIRFIKNSDSLLSPANQANPATHTCYIEYLSFSQQLAEFTSFTEVVGPQWASYGGLPHWAKIFQLVPGSYAESHAKLKSSGHLQPFLDQQKEFDPSNAFMNDFLNELLNGVASGAGKPIALRAGAQSAGPPATDIVRQFRIPGTRALKDFVAGKADAAKSERGCYLVHDCDNKVAILVDENRQANLMQYDEDSSNNQVTYRLLSSSQLLSPNEIFKRVGEVLGGEG
jgi:hypothetical protein